MGRCITVIGTHRSGTSALAGVLHRLGVRMFDKQIQPDRHNPLGFWEDAELVELNRRIVNWRRPRRVAFLPEDARAYRDLIARRKHHGAWGVKDPRLCLLGQHWLDALDAEGVDWRLVVMTRTPWASIKSLMRRERWSVERAEAVTNEHLKHMWPLYYQHTDKSAIVCYGTLLERPRDVARSLADIAGIEPTEEEFEHAVALVRPELCHHGA